MQYTLKLTVLFCALSVPVSAADARFQWQAGAASTVLTPEQDIWLAGYARKQPSRGTLQDVYAKALALQGSDGSRLVIVTCDLIGIPRDLRSSVEQQAQERYGLEPASLLLNASHTHTGPEVRMNKEIPEGWSRKRTRETLRYLKFAEERIVDAIEKALENMEPSQLAYSHARCGFAMNRRRPQGGSFRNAPNPEGPVDHSVPLLAVTAESGDLKALLFGYACHNTVLSGDQISGDYAGFAQEYLEEDHPGVTAMFLMGCGGDQNPYPRRKVRLAQEHGRALANAVEAALQTPQQPIGGPLRSTLQTVGLEFAPIDRDLLNRHSQSDNDMRRRRAAYLLDQLATSGSEPIEYEYPVQVVNFGNDLTLVALASEVVVDYSLRIKEELDAPRVWVAGYSNDIFGYVPSLRVLREGGYEGGGAMLRQLLPGPFAETVEERIMTTVRAAFDAVQVD